MTFPGRFRLVRLLPLFVTLLPQLAHSGDGASAAMGIADARHLLGRTGLGPTWGEIRATAELSRETAIERLLDETRILPVTPPPSWAAVFEPPLKMKTLSEAQRQEARKERRRKALELQAWWLREMQATPSPLTERMTLFWHGHFTSAQSKVRSPVLMYRQNALLREHALGRFDALLHDIAKDPAMLIYLDGRVNRKGRPNENFAREVMELFTLGEGHYTESDIKEAARAFTGWTVERQLGTLRFRPAWHDRGIKRLLGKRGRFDGGQVLDLLLARPETAEHIGCKLWQALISPECDQGEVKRIAAAFREQHYDTKALVRMLLSTDAFWATANRGSLVKSPVELLIGTRRQLGLPRIPAERLAKLSSQLGQQLFNPPNVKGWPGGAQWLDGRTLLLRQQTLRQWSSPGRSGPKNGTEARVKMTKGSDASKPRGFRVKAWIASLDGAPGWQENAKTLLLATPPVREPELQQPPLRYLRALLLDPVYQLK